MKLIIDIPDNEILIGWYTRSDGVNKYHNAKTLGEPNYILLDDVMVEPTCDTCEYNTAAFMPCNACEDKSEYKPQESEERNDNNKNV